VLTAQDDGAEKSPDPILLDRAAELQKVLFTRDDDLLESAAYRQENELHFSGVIDAHQLQVSIGGCVRQLELLANDGDTQDLENQVDFLKA